MKLDKGVLVVFIILTIITAFFVGRVSVRVEYSETTRYVRGENQIDSVEIPPPYRVEIPDMADVVLPMRADTVWRTIPMPITDTVWLDRVKTITQVVDTAQIISDFVAINSTFST